MSHRHIGSSKNREEARKRSYIRAQARNVANNEKNLVAHRANILSVPSTSVALNPQKRKTNRGNGNPLRLSRIKRALSRVGKEPKADA